jgi:hypothetical protein
LLTIIFTYSSSPTIWVKILFYLFFLSLKVAHSYTHYRSTKKGDITMRLPKKVLLNKFKYFCQEIGVEIGTKPGQWGLDSQSIYGGWVIVEYLEGGCEHHPVINRRVKASQMCDLIDAMMAILRLKKEIK